MNNHLNVLYAADNNYAPFLGVSVFSLLENNVDIDAITIYAVLDNVSDENKNRLSQLVREYKRELIVVDAAEFNTLMEKLGVPKYRGSYATHFRKFFYKIIRDDVERLLYLDSDTVVTGNLKSLLELDMGESCAGVVLDALAYRYKQLLGFGADEPYFNAGVTFIHVPNWKKNNCTDALMDHIKTVRSKYCNPDQDLFNFVLRGKTIVLPPEYNFMPVHRAYSDAAYGKVYGFEHYYTQEQIQYARVNPIILHTYRFLGEFPWHKGNCHPDTILFDSYLRRSPWKDYKKVKAKTGFIFKCEKLLYRSLPRGLFLRIFAAALYRSFYKKEMKLRKDALCK